MNKAEDRIYSVLGVLKLLFSGSRVETLLSDGSCTVFEIDTGKLRPFMGGFFCKLPFFCRREEKWKISELPWRLSSLMSSLRQ